MTAIMIKIIEHLGRITLLVNCVTALVAAVKGLYAFISMKIKREK